MLKYRIMLFTIRTTNLLFDAWYFLSFVSNYELFHTYHVKRLPIVLIMNIITQFNNLIEINYSIVIQFKFPRKFLSPIKE